MLNQQKQIMWLSAFLLAVMVALTAQSNQILMVSASEANAAQSEPGVAIGRSVRAGDVLGFKVRNPEGDNIGQVEDIVVNMVHSQVLFVTMSYDGGLFQSDKVFPVPVSAFSWDADKEELQLDLDEATLQDAPGFDSGWPDLTDPDFDQEVYDYWLGVFPDLPLPAEAGPVELAHVAKVSNMIGLEVINLNDESLGEVADVILNVELQQLSTVVLNFESYTGFGKEQYVMPLTGFEFDVSNEDEDNPAVIPMLDMSQNNLRNGPTFSDFVDLSDPNWSEPYQSWWQRMQSYSEQLVTPLTLAGTSWQVESFGEVEDNLPVITGTHLVLNFLGDKYAGSGGCNWFQGIYGAQADHGLRLQTPAQTRLPCEFVPVLNQEATYLSSLLNITEYELKDNQLIGYTVHNQRLLTFAPTEPVPFETTTWTLGFFRSGTRWRSGVLGTEITAQLEGDQLSGSAGCNTYIATVEKTGDKLAISNLTVTEKACTEPESIMTQEEEYLALLQAVGSMTQVGGILQLADVEGQPTLVFGVKELE